MMKSQIILCQVILYIFLFVFTLKTVSQVEVTCAVDSIVLVENFLGPGILVYSNLTYQGADSAKGLFTCDELNILGTYEGLFLCTGNGKDIPGPNLIGNAGTNNGLGGHPSLNAIATGSTFDAAVLEFDFIPQNDTIRFFYNFGSEAYNEYVESIYNDVCGVFITGPNPDGGFYNDKNLAIVPGTSNTPVSINNVNNGWAPVGVVPTGPCTNCQFFSDNTEGLYLQYDGFAFLGSWCLVVPYEEYHCKLGIADVSSSEKDSGVFFRKNGFANPGPAEFTAFNFLMSYNPGLPFDVEGVLVDNEVFLEVPANTDVTNLVANYEDLGAYVSVNGDNQENGVTSNDFSDPVVYQLDGSYDKDWTIYVEVVTNISEKVFRNITLYPNPSDGLINIKNAEEIDVKVFNLLGCLVFEQPSFLNQCSIRINDLQEGIYFVELSKDGFVETRKIIVN